MSSSDDQDDIGEPKPPRRRRTAKPPEPAGEDEPKPSRKRRAAPEADESQAEESEIAEAPKPARRKAARKPPTSDESEPAEEPAPRPKRAAKADTEKAVPPPAPPKKGAKPPAKDKAAAPAKVPPVGRIFRALWLARMIVRFSPIWGVALILFIIFGPGLIRSLRTPFQPPPVAPLFTPSVQYWASSIARWAEEGGVNPNLVATLMQIESCGYPGAASQVGAQGLFQVMPMNFPDEEQDKMTDPETNARRGVAVIRDCLRYAEGDVGLAMACYNGGPGLIYRNPATWPNESQRYYTWGGGIYNDAIRNASKSATLDDWLAAGGEGLCQKAAAALGLKITEQPAPSNPTAAPPPLPTLPVLPTLAVVDPGEIASPAPLASGLPTYAPPSNTPAVKIFITPGT